MHVYTDNQFQLFTAAKTLTSDERKKVWRQLVAYEYACKGRD